MSAAAPGARLRWPGRLGLGTVLAGTLAAMAAATVHLWPVAQANWLAMPALTQIRQWQSPGAKPPPTPVWLQVRAELAQALARSPESADLNEAMAYLYLSAALQPTQARLVQEAYLNEALRFVALVQQARPMTPTAWANEALALHALDALHPLDSAQTARLWASFDRAHRFGQRDAGVQLTLARVAFARWSALSPERQGALRALLAQATPEQRSALRALAQVYALEGVV